MARAVAPARGAPKRQWMKIAALALAAALCALGTVNCEPTGEGRPSEGRALGLIHSPNQV